MKTAWRIVLRICIATLIVVAVIVLTQDIQIFPGAAEGLLLSTKRDPATVPPGAESRFVKTSDGENLEVWYLPAKVRNVLASDGKELAAIVFHGNAGTVESFYSYQQWFQALGISSFGFDYRGYGKSSGWPSEEGLYRDGEAVWQFAQQKTGLGPEKFVFLGISIGTGLAARAARDHPPAALLLLAAYTSMPDVVRSKPYIRFLAPLLWYHLPTAEYLKELRATCVVAAHGKRDDTIPFSHLAGIKAASSDSSRFAEIVSDRAGHNDLFYLEKPRLERELGLCLAGKS